MDKKGLIDDDAYSVIMKKLWIKLRKTQKLKTLKLKRQPKIRTIVNIGLPDRP
jgi:hypothetical protein